MPMRLTPSKLRILDQLLFRFTQPQDAMGLCLVAATLAALSEPYQDWAVSPPSVQRSQHAPKMATPASRPWAPGSAPPGGVAS